ncbi:MAG: hypothetical protein DSZ28_07840 [Thiothrix sp.]|nr:MAG: hypothetical protein DSZ28_07840 [Thiothrix sp.]
MEIALSKERDPLWRRSCPELNDIDFIRLGILRCIDAVDSGRHLLQTTQQVHKENSVATFVQAIEFDNTREMNTGIEGYSLYENSNIKFSVADYRDPGTIAMLYYKRWTIEKTFNNHQCSPIVRSVTD